MTEELLYKGLNYRVLNKSAGNEVEPLFHQQGNLPLLQDKHKFLLYIEIDGSEEY